MKIKYYLLLIISLLFIAGCDDEKEVIERNELKLSVSSESLILDENELEKDVLTFSWNKATDIGSDYTFSYLFQLDVADNNFASATDVVVLDENGSFSFNTLELYNLVVEKWKKKAGEPVQLEARVSAKVTGPKFQYPEIAIAKTRITTYVPVSQPLYLIGSATDAGMDPDKGVRMEELSNGRLYNWKGSLKVGNFKFISVLGSMLPSYNKGADNNTIVERKTESDPDDYFEITEAGTYYIYVSKKDMTISFKRVLYETLYLVGSATAAGWELNSLLPMTPDDLNPNVFVYQGPLQEGEMKILTQREWDVPTFKPKVADGSIESEEVQLLPGQDPDHKWKVTSSQAGLYKITLDTEALTIKFEKQ